jgi:hypothetical protein
MPSTSCWPAMPIPGTSTSSLNARVAQTDESGFLLKTRPQVRLLPRAPRTRCLSNPQRPLRSPTKERAVGPILVHRLGPGRERSLLRRMNQCRGSALGRASGLRRERRRSPLRRQEGSIRRRPLLIVARFPSNWLPRLLLNAGRLAAGLSAPVPNARSFKQPPRRPRARDEQID